MTGGSTRRETSMGIVTFLFSDIEGSTALLRQLGDDYSVLLAEHRDLLGRVFQAHEGSVVDTEGDAFFVAFARAKDALAAALDAQRTIASHHWPGGLEVRVRIGIHTGDALLTETGYVGLAVHQAARVCAAAHGGQVLISEVTRHLVGEALPTSASLEDLGSQRLRDFEAPQRVFQLRHPDLRSDFPPLRAGERAREREQGAFVLSAVGPADTQPGRSDKDASPLTVHGELVRRALLGRSQDRVENVARGLLVRFDSAPEALRYAIRLQQAALRHNRRTGSERLECRVSIHAYASRDRSQPVDAELIAAAVRTSERARAGQILASASVRWLLEREMEDAGIGAAPLAEDGGAGNAALFELKWQPRRALPLPAPLARKEELPFQGRERALEELRRAWRKAQAGEPQLVLLAGEPGIGKTRLAIELACAVHAEGATLLLGRCDEERIIPYQPLVEALRHYLNVCQIAELRDQLGSSGGELARLLPELSECLPELTEPPPAAPEAERHRLFEAVSELLEATALAGELVLVLDDLQWADTSSLLFLRHLARRAEGCPLMVIGTYRDIELGRRHPLAQTMADLRREAGFTRVSLEGLREPEVAALVEAAGVGGADARALARVLRDETEGNPLFIGEMLRNLAESGALARLKEVSFGRLVLEQLGIPEGVKELIGRRIARLSDSGNQLLVTAAVIGREFGLEVLERVAGLAEEELLDAVEEAIAAGLVAEAAGTRPCFSFSHALVRDTLYEELSSLRRYRLHRRVAEAMEELWRDAPDAPFEELAHHFMVAAERGGDVAKAIQYASRAAERASAAFAYEDAERHLRRALELVAMLPATPQRAQHELALLAKLSLILMTTRGYAAAEVREACDRALAICDEGTEVPPQLASPLWRLGQFYTVRGDVEGAREVAERLLELAGRSSTPAFRLAALHLLGVNALQRGELTVARRRLEDGMSLADSCDDFALIATIGHDMRVVCRAYLAWIRWLLGAEGPATELAREAVRLADRLGHAPDRAFALCFEAILCVFRRRPAAVRERAEQALAISSEFGFAVWGAVARVLRGWALAEQGEPERGVGEISEGLDAGAATGARVAGFFLALLAEAHRAAGRPQQALAVVEEALAKVEEGGQRFWDPELYRLRGELMHEVAPDRGEEAAVSLREAILVAKAQQGRALELRAEASLRRTLGK